MLHVWLPIVKVWEQGERERERERERVRIRGLEKVTFLQSEYMAESMQKHGKRKTEHL